MAKRKCVICGQPIEDNNASIPYKNRYAHQKCFQSMTKMATTQKKKELKEKAATKKRKSTKPKAETIKDALSEEEYQQKTDLYKYIKSLTNTEDLSAKVYVLVEDYIKKYNYTYQGIQNTLYYFYEIKGNQVREDCVGIIPYVYTEAQNYYLQIENLEKSIQGKDIKNMYKTKVIKVPQKQKKKEQELLDITDIK